MATISQPAAKTRKAPTMRFLSVFDEHWRSSLPLSLGGIMTGNVITYLAHLDWGQVFAAAGIAITSLGGAGIGLYRQWVLTRVEIAERRRRLAELDADRLDPDATAAAEVREPHHPKRHAKAKAKPETDATK
jgi:hypothetical protein